MLDPVKPNIIKFIGRFELDLQVPKTHNRSLDSDSLLPISIVDTFLRNPANRRIPHDSQHAQTHSRAEKKAEDGAKGIRDVGRMEAGDVSTVDAHAGEDQEYGGDEKVKRTVGPSVEDLIGGLHIRLIFLRGIGL